MCPYVDPSMTLESTERVQREYGESTEGCRTEENVRNKINQITSGKLLTEKGKGRCERKEVQGKTASDLFRSAYASATGV